MSVHTKADEQTDQVYELVDIANDLMFLIWKENILFTWEWWLGASLSVIPWIVWFICRKRHSTARLLYAGVLIMLLSSWFDFIGVTLGLWTYNNDVIPTVPGYEPWDFTLLPVALMFMMQIKPQTSAFLKAALFGGLVAFVGEPIFDWLDFFEYRHWRHIYSFPIYIVIYLLCHYLSSRNSWAPLRS